MTSEGWLWSEPDGQQSEKVVPVSIGLRLHIEGTPVAGNPPPDSNTDGLWCRAVVENEARPWSLSVGPTDWPHPLGLS